MINMLRATRRPVTLRRALLGALTICLAGLAGFLVMALLISPRLAQQMDYAAPEASSPVGDNTSSRVEELVDRLDCWTGDAPADMAGELPGHAVVTPPGSSHPEYVGPLWAGRALEHVFNGKHPRLTVHAFCR